MKMIYKFLGISLLTLPIVHADVWHKPPYKQDENHLPRETVVPREAQEERPKSSMEETKRHQEVKKPNSDTELEKIDDQMNEGEESNQ